MALHRLKVELHTLKIKRELESFEFVLPTGSSLTEIDYERNGGNVIPPGCRTGACGACLIKVTSGLKALSPRDDDEESFIELLGYTGEEYRLACQCRLNGEVAIDIIG